MRTPAINDALQSTLSSERLRKYLANANGNLDRALCLYERNMRLSSAFYVPLQCLEVCLRNKMHNELAKKYGAEWYVNGKPGLQVGTVKRISDVIHELGKSGSQTTPGAVVAELSFGVWVSLLGTAYDATLWRSALANAFQEHGKNMRRDRVHGRLNALRRFRNRVAHHEPIFDRKLTDVHAELIEAIAWLCRDTSVWAASQSQVLPVISSP